MTERRPLVRKDGRLEELPATDRLQGIPGFAATAWATAGFSSPNITRDAANGQALCHTRTMAGNETLAIPSNLPDGGTLYDWIVAGAHTLSFASGYVGAGNDLPDVTGNALLSTVRQGSIYIVSALSDLGDGS